MSAPTEEESPAGGWDSDDSTWVMPDAEWERRIQAAVRHQTRKYAHGWDEIEMRADMGQHVLLRWLENQRTVKRYLAEGEAGVNPLTSCLYKWASEFGRAEAEARGEEADQWVYSVEQIREMIPYVDTPEAWSTMVQLGPEPEVDRRKTKIVSHEGNGLAFYADLRRGWDALTEEQRDLLRLRCCGAGWEETAQAMGATEAACRQRVRRAERRMQRVMGARMPRQPTG